jgi:hypothetical protein
VLSGSCHRFLHFFNGSTYSSGSSGRELRAGARLEAERDANRRDEESVSKRAGWSAGHSGVRTLGYERPRSRRPRRKRFVLEERVIEAILRQVRRSEKSFWWARCDPRDS